MQAEVVAEITGQLRHDCWKDKDGKWTGKVYIAPDPGEGQVRSTVMAETATVA